MRTYMLINIHRSEVHRGSAVRFSQALPGILITAPPSVCVSAVLVSLAVWIQTQFCKKSIGLVLNPHSYCKKSIGLVEKIEREREKYILPNF